METIQWNRPGTYSLNSFANIGSGRKLWVLGILLVCIIVLCNGCALLQIPFYLLDKLIALAERLPKPPPGVFF